MEDGDPSGVGATSAIRAGPWSPPRREDIHALLIDCDPVCAADLAEIAARSKQLNFDIAARRTLPAAEAEWLAGRFDVIFLEYWHGSETCVPFLHANAALQGPPCVVLTDLDEPDIRRVVFRAGAGAFLSKDSLNPQALESVTLAVLRDRMPAALAG